jgi:hypothetical protein
MNLTRKVVKTRYIIEGSKKKRERRIEEKDITMHSLLVVIKGDNLSGVKQTS